MNNIGLEILENNVLDLKIYTCFREYILNEAKQVGFIYHFTTLTRINSILKSKLNKGHQKYLSLTRDFQLPNEKGYFNTGEYIVRLTIDGDKLSNNVKIIPYRDKAYNDEREEGVLNDIKLNYIKQVDILTSDNRIFSREYIDFVFKNLKSNIPINLVKKFQPVK